MMSRLERHNRSTLASRCGPLTSGVATPCIMAPKFGQGDMSYLGPRSVSAFLPGAGAGRGKGTYPGVWRGLRAIIIPTQTATLLANEAFD